MSGNNFTYGRNDTFGTEIDYGDVPENMDEAHMRAYLALESRLIMPNQNQNDSFEQKWKDGRQEYVQNNKQQFPSKPNYSYKDSQTEALSNINSINSNNNNTSNDRNRNNTNTTVVSSIYPDSAAYRDPIIDRNSTITMIPQKNARTQHSFQKQQVLNQNPINNHNNNDARNHINNRNHPNTHNQAMAMNSNQNQSALTAQIAPQKQQLANQKQDNIGVIQSRNGSGLLVIKQMPYSKKTHVCLHIFVEIKPDHIEHIIVYFQKHFSVTQFLNLLKNGTNNAMFKDHELQIFCADDEGDLDDDFPSPETNAIIANLGLSNFYIKLSNELNEKQRDELRRTTLNHKQHLRSEEEMDRQYNVNEDEETESSEYEDEYEEDSGCKCVIL